ncbi:MAG TPA: glycosyltransferase [Candidatus Bathyarchaeia archaeon]|nr:glycosyltransferase [Candidatus Bathyarchaeia archaeon]
MKKKKLTVSIGIPAYNEEKNIGNLLKSLLRQKEKTIEIKEIIVASDGSTDNTVSLVRSFKEPRICCIEGRLRLGKPSRLNQLFTQLKTDILVILDADTICKDQLTIERLVSGFSQDKNVGLVTGNRQPLPAKTFIENAVNNYIYARNSVSEKFDFGNTGYSTHGFLAYSKKFLHNFHIPPDILNDDAFSYFTCITSSFKHIYIKRAVAYSRYAGTPLDYFKQMTRYITGGFQLQNYFDKNLVTNSINLPLRIQLQIMMYQAIRNPLGYIVLKLLTLTSCLCCKRKCRSYNVTWTPIITSKSLT